MVTVCALDFQLWELIAKLTLSNERNWLLNAMVYSIRENKILLSNDRQKVSHYEQETKSCSELVRYTYDYECEVPEKIPKVIINIDDIHCSRQLNI